jgi:hypothetical protein
MSNKWLDSLQFEILDITIQNACECAVWQKNNHFFHLTNLFFNFFKKNYLTNFIFNLLKKFS